MKQKYEKKSCGFTIIELLIVITIIGVLTSVVLVALGAQRQKARDSRRVSDLRQIKTAFDLYLAEASGYPDPSTWVPSTILECTGLTIIRIPTDPFFPTYTYGYSTSGQSTVTTVCGGSVTIWQSYRIDFYMESRGAWYYMNDDNAVFDSSNNPVTLDDLF